MKTYIHYGHKHFDKELFQPIKNRKFRNKSTGGFWASDINSKYGWKDWSEKYGFRKYEEDNSFKFKLKDNANILEIHRVEDLRELPKLDFKMFGVPDAYLDFEKILQMGYDAIELFLSDDEKLYWNLYGWDCDSILVMNPDIIEEVK